MFVNYIFIFMFDLNFECILYLSLMMGALQLLLSQVMPFSVDWPGRGGI